ncbi:hypothetical protein OL233_04465 [Vagococcus sp. PNs007]|uniref:DUF4367 domain-containing protein n=1 Tax=Vagococcus proximus TaxID=2991417 RepID=A0ABT5X0K5_9ENTE|nr:hypothetical protein [Vagococcus proximus]MDF0479536.1 hypothetical protein [Vagococcus proximus]
MLSFEEKKAIFDEFEELTCQPVSMNRLNYHYEGSAVPKTTVVKFLHPKSGNAFVYAGYLAPEKTKDGYVSVIELNREELIEYVRNAIEFLNLTEDGYVDGYEEEWSDAHDDRLYLRYQNYMWVVVMQSGGIEAVFKTKEQAEAYLMDEGFN